MVAGLPKTLLIVPRYPEEKIMAGFAVIQELLFRTAPTRGPLEAPGTTRRRQDQSVAKLDRLAEIGHRPCGLHLVSRRLPEDQDAGR